MYNNSTFIVELFLSTNHKKSVCVGSVLGTVRLFITGVGRGYEKTIEKNVYTKILSVI